MLRNTCKFLLALGAVIMILACAGGMTQARGPKNYSLAIKGFSPSSGQAGTTVTITGAGFSHTRSVDLREFLYQGK